MYPLSSRLVIAIDGPSGVGKSTAARSLADRLGCAYIETGAMYRAVALRILERHLDLSDPVACGGEALMADIQFHWTRSGNRILLDGTDVTETIRAPEVTQAASIISTHPPVREALVARQRELGHPGCVVLEGRDIGTVVFPNADVKVFLDAAPEVRHQRRMADPETAAHTNPDEVHREIEERDNRDRTRPHSPLEPAADAVLIDTTDLTADEVLTRILRLVPSTPTD